MVDAMALLFSRTPLYVTSKMKFTNLDGTGFSIAPSETPLIEITFGLCQFPDVIARPQVTVSSETNLNKVFVRMEYPLFFRN